MYISGGDFSANTVLSAPNNIKGNHKECNNIAGSIVAVNNTSVSRGGIDATESSLDGSNPNKNLKPKPLIRRDGMTDLFAYIRQNMLTVSTAINTSSGMVVCTEPVLKDHTPLSVN